MTRAKIAGGVFPIVLVLLALAAGYRALNQDVHPAAATSPAITPSTTPPAAETHPAVETYQGFLYGRITTKDGATYEGRLRWGGDEEAFWGDYFNGSKDKRTPGSPKCHQSGCPRSAARSRSSGSRSATGSARSTSAGFSSCTSATSRASRRAAVTCGWLSRTGPCSTSTASRPTTSTTCGCGTAGRASSTSTVCGSAPSSSSPPPGSAPPPAGCTVTLQNGEELQFERTGNLREGNAGMLIFVEGRQRPEYVAWTDVGQVDFDRRPPASDVPAARRALATLKIP